MSAQMTFHNDDWGKRPNKLSIYAAHELLRKLIFANADNASGFSNDITNLKSHPDCQKCGSLQADELRNALKPAMYVLREICEQDKYNIYGRGQNKNGAGFPEMAIAYYVYNLVNVHKRTLSAATALMHEKNLCSDSSARDYYYKHREFIGTVLEAEEVYIREYFKEIFESELDAYLDKNRCSRVSAK